jgi:putative DNA primase/helicase
MSAVMNMVESSQAFMDRDLRRSGLLADDFPIPPQPLTAMGDAPRYRIHYTADYYKDRIDREDDKYIGKKGETPPTPILSLSDKPEQAFARASVNAVAEGYKKSLLFALTTEIPVAVIDHCWGFGEATDDGEAKQIKNELLEGLSHGKVHIALFDGDWYDNDNVGKALATYAMQLDALGVHAVFPDLGKDEDGNRQGYDDWFVNTYGVDREKWPSSEDVIKALLALPQVPVTELEAARKYALGSAELFNKGHIDFSDRGNATQFARLVGSNNIRYLVDTRKWVLWEGGRWREYDERPLEKTNIVGLHYYKRAERLETIAHGMPNDEKHTAKRDALLKQAGMTRKWASGHCSTNGGRKAILEDIQSRRDFQAKLSDFDANPDVLAVENGIVDLRTGALRPETQEDRILKRAVASYSENEPTGEGAFRIQKFVREITGSAHGAYDEQSMRYLQRRLGASLRGRNSLDALEIWHGRGSNGKSVLSGMMEKVLGEYVKTIPASALMSNAKGANPEGATPFLSMAIGRRIVFLPESRDTDRLNEQIVKQVTGGDKLNTRDLYMGGSAHDITFTPILLTNALPHVSEGDAALWDRLTPFSFRVRWKRPSRLDYEDDEVDLPLGDLWLRDEAKGDPDAQRWLLWWLVQGSVAWGREGLGSTPPHLIADVREYKGAQDKLGRWMDEEGWVLDPEGKEKTGDVYASYAQWSEREGSKPLAAPQFTSRFKNYTKGRVEATKSGDTRFLKGIRRARPSKC